MALTRYRPNRRGIRGLLESPRVAGALSERGLEVAAAARASYTARPPHSGRVEVVTTLSQITSPSPRPRVAVIAQHPGALHIEADRRPLGGALDAAG